LLVYVIMKEIFGPYKVYGRHLFAQKCFYKQIIRQQKVVIFLKRICLSL